ncbi:Cytochrome P460 [Methylomagnum ishizawai]|uniref:Cytochrome P460 n=1 Tax=Methylomagnum ishizawai TaxID=1760988 RepID=A0A1Y6D4L7_9GAMM|nr:cytochrome P460 family protein [Methylomagnum ishizawai]SMF95324.1 Cytochrome P460 [Methylomagnum ishizawai]
MKRSFFVLALALNTFPCHADPAAAPPAPNGITLPKDYQNWRLLGVSQRTENGTLRAILGNDKAIEAARSGQTHPWPDGAMLAKVAWKQKSHDKFATAVVPGEYVHTDLMVKDAAKYAATGGWGFARWLGDKFTPYGQDAQFAQECLGCHGAAKDADWVFTTPAKLP